MLGFWDSIKANLGSIMIGGLILFFVWMIYQKVDRVGSCTIVQKKYSLF